MDYALSGVVPDDSDTGRAPEQSIYVAITETGTVTVTVRYPSGSLFNLSAGALIFTVKDLLTNTPLIAREAVVASPATGVGVFTFYTSDTVNLRAQKYTYDVQFRPTVGGNLPVIAPSPFIVTPSVGLPGEDVTVPEAEQPLGLGPQGEQGEPGEQGEQGEQGEPGPPAIGVVAWTADKTWAEVQAEIDAADGDATIFMGNAYAPGLPVGAFQVPADAVMRISGCRFVSVSGYGSFTLLNGATIAPDSSDTLTLILDSVVMYTQGSVTASGTTVYAYTPNGGGIYHTSNLAPAFPGGAEFYIYATSIEPPYYLAAPLYKAGTQPAVNLAAAGACYIIAYGNLQVGAGSIGGGAGSTVTLTLDGLARAQYVSPVTGSATVNAIEVAPQVLLDSTAFSAVGKPAGILGRNSSTGKVQCTTGSAWADIAASADSLTLTGTVGIAQHALVSQDATNLNFFKYDPADAGTTSWYQWAASFSNGVGVRRNQVMRFGWNAAPGGGVVTGGALNGALASSYEQYFEGSFRQMERHETFVDPTGRETRWLSFLGAVEAPYTTTLFVYSDNLYLGVGAGGNDRAVFTADVNNTRAYSPNTFNRLVLNDTHSQLQAGTTESPLARLNLIPAGDVSLRGLRGYMGRESYIAFKWDDGFAEMFSPDGQSEVFISNGGIQLLSSGTLNLRLLAASTLVGCPLVPSGDKSTSYVLGGANARYGWVAASLASGSLPAASSATEGFMTVVPGGAGVPSTFQVVMKGSDNNYAWRTVYTAP